MIEVAIFAPVAAYPAIRELAGISVRLHYCTCSDWRLITLLPQPPSAKDDKAKVAGVFVATGSRDKTIRLWDSASGQCLKTLVRTPHPIVGIPG